MLNKRIVIPNYDYGYKKYKKYKKRIYDYSAI